MRTGIEASAGDVGRTFSLFTFTARPNPLEELDAWGGEELVGGKRVLDLGCGDGRFALGLAALASSVDALDPDPAAISAAKQTAKKAGIRNARFAVGAAQKLRYPDRSFDVVILSWTL